MSDSTPPFPPPPAPRRDVARVLMPFAFGGGLVLVALGYVVLFVVMLNPKSADAVTANGPMAMVPGTVAAGFSMEEFATEADASRADEVLKQAGVLSQRQRLEKTVAEVGGDIEIGLMWEGTSDIDLSVVEPDGRVISADGQTSPHGRLDVDANPTPLTFTGAMLERAGRVVGLDNMVPVADSDFNNRITKPIGPNHPQSLWSRHPIEHIAFRTPPAGRYVIRVRCFGWRDPSPLPLPLPVIVELRCKDRVVARIKGSVGPVCYISDRIPPTAVASFDVR